MGEWLLPEIEVQLCILEAYSREEGLVLGQAVRQFEGCTQRPAVLGEGDFPSLEIQQAANHITLCQD